MYLSIQDLKCSKLSEIYDTISRTDIENILDNNNLDSYCNNMLNTHKTQLLDDSNDPVVLAKLFEKYIESTPNLFLVKRNESLLTKIKQYVQESITSERGITPFQALILSQSFLPPKFTQGFDDIPNNIHFPQDHHIHKNTNIGWYFLVSNINTLEGLKYGVVLIFWYLPIFPEPFLVSNNIDPKSFFCHFITFTITDIMNQTFYKNNSGLVNNNTGLLNSSTLQDGHIHYTSGKNLLYSKEDNLSHLFINVEDTSVNQDSMSIQMEIKASKPLFLQGDGGCAPCFDRTGSLYYSYPRYSIENIILSVNSKILVSNTTIDKLNSFVWLDHQWTYQMMRETYFKNTFVQALSNITPKPSFNGWFWFCGHLMDGRDMTAVVASKYIDSLPIHHKTYENLAYKMINKNGSTSELKVDGSMVAKHWKSMKWNSITLFVPTEWDLYMGNERFTFKSLYDFPIFPNRMGDFVREGPVSIYKENELIGEGFAEVAGFLSSKEDYFNYKLELLGSNLKQDSDFITQNKISNPNDQVVNSYLYFLLIGLILILFILLFVMGIRYLLKKSKKP